MMIMDLVISYAWLVILVVLVLTAFSSKREEGLRRYIMKFGPSLYFLFFAAVDLANNNCSGMKVSLELAGILFLVSLLKHFFLDKRKA